MVGFNRKNIPALSCGELIDTLNYNTMMGKIALDVASGRAPMGKCKSYSYYCNNANLLNDELHRRMERGERIIFIYSKWRTIDDAYPMMEEEKEERQVRILDTLDDITLTEEERRDIIKKYEEDIEYIDIRIKQVRWKFF